MPIVLAILSSTMSVVPVFLIGSLAVLIRDSLRVSLPTIGWTFVAFYLGSSLTSAPAGYVVQRKGWRWGLHAAAGLTAMALLGLGLLTAGWIELLAFAILGGAGYAFAQVASSMLIAEEVKLRRGLAFGIKQAAVPSAGILAGLALPVLGLKIGWESTFALFGLVELGYLVFLPKGSSSRGLDALPIERVRRRVSDLRSLILVAIAGGLGAATANTLGAYYVEGLVDAGVGESSAGMLLAGGSVVGLVARVGMGWYADRSKRGTLAPIAWMLIIGAFGFLMFVAEPSWVRLPATLLAFGAGWGWPGLFSFAVVRLNPDAPASATGIAQIGAFTGAGLGPILFGMAADHWGFATAWILTAGCAFLGGLCVFIARRLVRDRIDSRRSS